MSNSRSEIKVHIAISGPLYAKLGKFKKRGIGSGLQDYVTTTHYTKCSVQ